MDGPENQPPLPRERLPAVPPEPQKLVPPVLSSAPRKKRVLPLWVWLMLVFLGGAFAIKGFQNITGLWVTIIALTVLCGFVEKSIMPMVLALLIALGVLGAVMAIVFAGCLLTGVGRF
jgi:hypothetical protein